MASQETESVRIDDVGKRLRQSTKTLSPVRQRLLDSGLLKPAGHGRLRFTLPGYGAYVRHRSCRVGAGTGSPR